MQIAAGREQFIYILFPYLHIFPVAIEADQYTILNLKSRDTNDGSYMNLKSRDAQV